MRPFRLVLEHPVYWTLNRRNVTRAFALGLFIAFVPAPIHLFIAAALALFLRLNIPAAIAGTLLTNPLTAAPIYVSAYLLGSRLLGVPARPFTFEMSWSWWSTTLLPIWKPLMLGCLVLGTLTACAGYLLLTGAWRLSLVLKYHRRKSAGGERESMDGEK